MSLSAYWEELPQSVLDDMKFLGNFGPTIKAENKQLKGYMDDGDGVGKTYLSVEDLRSLAASCLTAALWLEQRAELALVIAPGLSAP